MNLRESFSGIALLRLFWEIEHLFIFTLLIFIVEFRVKINITTDLLK